MSDEIIKRPHMSSLKRARAAILERSAEIVEAYIALAATATAEKDFETAADILWKLIDHSEDEDGDRIIAPSASKPPQNQAQGQIGPAIQIGIALGGIGIQKQLPSAEVIDVSPINDPKKPTS